MCDLMQFDSYMSGDNGVQQIDDHPSYVPSLSYLAKHVLIKNLWSWNSKYVGETFKSGC